MKHNKIGLTLICIVSMLSSCVQGNLYELYDDIDMELSLNRKNVPRNQQLILQMLLGLLFLRYLKMYLFHLIVH